MPQTWLAQNISRRLLSQVRNPAQYIGSEINEIKKPLRQGDTSVALGFPDSYAVGMSHLGLAILYTALNELPFVRAERTFCPEMDARAVMLREKIPLFSWENRQAIGEFDVLAISLQNEQCYSNLLYMLDLAGLALRSQDRDESHPLVIAGGTMADCCEPVADFLDLVILGDGEESLVNVVTDVHYCKKQQKTKQEMLLALAQKYPYVYVPQFYRDRYNSDGTLASIQPVVEGAPEFIEHARVEDLPSAAFPDAPIVAHTEVIHNRIAIEVMRGCPMRCAFCHAGWTRGKTKFRSIEQIVEIAWKNYLATGHDEISLLSLSTSDYPELEKLTVALYQKFEGLNVSISLPSLRVDKQLTTVPTHATQVRKGSLTIAVEAARDELRQAIGKKVTDTDLMETIRNAFQAGWRRAKLYFMVGFPGETDDDLHGIVDLLAQVSQLGNEVFGRPAQAAATISWLVPKPHTTFSWIPMRDKEYFLRARRLILDYKSQLPKLPIKFRFHEVESSILEGVFARGDRRLGVALETAYKNGACFDAWSEHLKYDVYLDAFAEHHIDPAWYAHRQRPESEILPWDHLDQRNRQSLYRKHTRTLEKITTELEHVG